MQAAAKLSSAALAEVPADIATALASGDWRRRAAWPVSLTEANDIAAAQMRRALGWLDAVDEGFARDAALLALPTILAYGRAIVLAALAAERLNRSGGRFVTAIPEIAFMQTGEGDVAARANPVLPPEPIRYEFARRAARCYSWTGAARLLPSLVAPSAVAVSHNSLLRGAAAGGKRAVGYRHAESFLRKARRAGGTEGSATLLELARPLARTVLGDVLEASEYAAARAHRLLEAMARPHLQRAGRNMAALRRVRLPREVWSGSGGLYAPRAVGLEVLQRGGRVVRFDHGTPRGFVASQETTVLLELVVSSEFVLATDDVARICGDEGEVSLVRFRSEAVICGWNGDPTFARAARIKARRWVSRRPRVVYVPTQLLGFRQLLPVQLPDVVHLNWQMEVTEALRAMPVDLVCQPHPEGYFKGKPHPLEAVAPTVRGNFGGQLQTADVFVFDYPSTTALWEAACTDARIVFLEIGAGTMTPEVARLFAKRVRVIPVDHDERNRPVLDAAALREAVLAGGEPPDPSAFRRLLAGEG